MSVRAIGKRIIVERAAAQEKVGDLYIPDTNKEKPSRGKIISVGEEVTGLAPGNLILFGKYAGTEIEVGVDKYLVLNYDEILAVE